MFSLCVCVLSHVGRLCNGAVEDAAADTEPVAVWKEGGVAGYLSPDSSLLIEFQTKCRTCWAEPLIHRRRGVS